MSDAAAASSGSSGAADSGGSAGAEGVDNSGGESTEGQAPAAGGQKDQAKTVPPTLKEKFKLTVDGEEIEDEVDWNDKEGIRRRLQLAHAARKRMTEAQSVKNQAQEIMKAIESGDEALFEKLGPKGREIAEKFLLKQIKLQMETPEEKQARLEREELESLRAEKNKTKEQKEKDAETARQNHYAVQFQKTIMEALDKSGLPKTPESVKRVAGLMKKNLEMGLDLTADDLAIEARGDISGVIKSIVKDADGDQIISMFGEDIVNKIRKADIRRLQEKHNMLSNPRSSGNQEPQQRSADKPRRSLTEWKNALDEKVRE